MQRSEPIPVLLLARELMGGGSERQLVNVACGLDQKLFAPRVATSRVAPASAEELQAASVPVHQVPLGRPITAISAWSAVWRICRTHRIRVVHAFDKPMAIYGLPGAWAARTEAVLSSERSSRSIHPKLIPLLRTVDRIVDGVVVNGLAVQGEMADVEQFPLNRLHLCYNGINLGQFGYIQDRVAREPELRGASPIVGCVAMLRPEKDLVTLVRAFASLRAQFPAAKLVIVGWGAEQPAIEQCAQELGVRDALLLPGRSFDVLRWLHQFDIFVLPSVSEAFSNSLMEAMATGCACIASRVGGNPELIQHEATGLLFDARDSAQLSTQLIALAASRELRQQIGLAGSQLIHSRFSIAASVARMQEIYLSHLSGGHSQIQPRRR
jgi:glycosyltransferase involved in cell wall biosynthesis